MGGGEAEHSIGVRSPCYCCWLDVRYMYVLCRRHGDELPLEVERLWATLAVNRRNIIPLLDFLVSLGCHMACQVCWTCVMVPRSFALTPCPCDPWSCLSCSCTRAHCERSSMRCPQELGALLEYLGVAKRICLYLARVSPQQTIDHLVYEASLLLHEDDPMGNATGFSCSNISSNSDPLKFGALLATPEEAVGASSLVASDYCRNVHVHKKPVCIPCIPLYCLVSYGVM